MQIHRVKPGESVYSIAREYGVSPSKIIEINGLKKPDSLAVGRELLILTPTRTYTARRGDTLESISKRFSVSSAELVKNNPSLFGSDKIYPEQVFAVKYPEKSHGIALLIGYLYKGCPKERLDFTMPYLSHLILSSCVYEGKRMRSLFDTRETLKTAKELSKKALLRIQRRGDAYDEKFIPIAIDAAVSGGFDGIVLSCKTGLGEGENADFLFELKKAALAEGLTMSLESDGSICERCADLSDSVILCRDDCLDKSESIDCAYREYAKERDALRAFIDLSPFAYVDGEAIPIDTALTYADREGAEIKEDESGSLLSFRLRDKDVKLPSLKNIKSKLDLVGELGYLGCAIDIMRCPINHLMMLSSLFHLSPPYFSGGM